MKTGSDPHTDLTVMIILLAGFTDSVCLPGMGLGVFYAFVTDSTKSP